MLLDKLTVCNQALIATGNTPVTTDDGSAQWIAASTAYDRMLPLVLYKHNWTFQTNTLSLARLGTSTYPGYSDIYQKPTDCLHLENVWRTDLAASMPQVSSFGVDGMGAMPPPLDYRIVSDQIHCVAPNGVTALYVIDPAAHSEVILDVNPGILETLTREIESLLYQGLNEDNAGAVATKKLAAVEISEARAKADSEMPRRVAFRSSFIEKRRRRATGWWL
jgi:hypothetical protein